MILRLIIFLLRLPFALVALAFYTAILPVIVIPLALTSLAILLLSAALQLITFIPVILSMVAGISYYKRDCFNLETTFLRRLFSVAGFWFIWKLEELYSWTVECATLGSCCKAERGVHAACEEAKRACESYTLWYSCCFREHERSRQRAEDTDYLEKKDCGMCCGSGSRSLVQADGTESNEYFPFHCCAPVAIEVRGNCGPPSTSVLPNRS